MTGGPLDLPHDSGLVGLIVVGLMVLGMISRSSLRWMDQKGALVLDSVSIARMAPSFLSIALTLILSLIGTWALLGSFDSFGKRMQVICLVFIFLSWVARDGWIRPFTDAFMSIICLGLAIWCARVAASTIPLEEPRIDLFAISAILSLGVLHGVWSILGHRHAKVFMHGLELNRGLDWLPWSWLRNSSSSSDGTGTQWRLDFEPPKFLGMPISRPTQIVHLQLVDGSQSAILEEHLQRVLGKQAVMLPDPEQASLGQTMPK